jgi:CBS domain-containing protein
MTTLITGPAMRAHFYDVNPQWLATFNMIPGFPLHGGRVLRALLWWTTGDADRSTRLAARAGQGVGFLFILIGVWQFLSGAGFGSLWIALIGWFLLDAAGASYAQVGMVAGLRGLRVKDIMTDDCVRIDGNSTIETFADEHLLRTWRRCFVVEEGGKITGLVTPSDIKQIERSRWPTTTVHTVMRPLSRLRTVTPDTPLIEALHTMGREAVNQLPVWCSTTVFKECCPGATLCTSCNRARN